MRLTWIHSIANKGGVLDFLFYRIKRLLKAKRKLSEIAGNIRENLYTEPNGIYENILILFQTFNAETF